MEKKEFQGKSVQEALQKACVYFDVDESGLLYTVLNESSRGFLGFKSKDARIEAEMLPKKLSIEEDIVRFLSPLFEQMALSPTIRVRQEESNVFVDIDGDDVGILIGHHGETMYAIQYLLSLAINKKQDTYYKIILDDIAVLKYHGTLAELGNIVLMGYEAYSTPLIIKFLEKFHYFIGSTGI